MLKATVDGRAVADAIAELKTIDPKLYTALRAELRTSLGGPARAIENAWPSTSPLSGMSGFGRTAYQPVTTSVAFTPGRARRGAVSTLIGITAKIPKARVGGWIGEMAGMRRKFGTGMSRSYSKSFGTQQHALNGQGEAMVTALNQRYPMSGNGGRFGWRKFVNMKDNLQNLGIGILEKHVAILNRGK